jgi:hypothetical protein
MLQAVDEIPWTFCRVYSRLETLPHSIKKRRECNAFKLNHFSAAISLIF